jgi:hypothetical protein
MFSYVGGAIRSKVLVYLAMAGDESAEQKIPLTHFVLWDQGTWRTCHERRWLLAGVAVAKQPLEQMIAVGEWGDVYCIGSRDTHDEHVASGKGGPKDRGPMRGVRRIGARIYAVGMDRQAYRRETANQWSNIGPPSDKSDEVHGFEAVDGFDESQIYAVGWEGEIWKYDGQAWSALPSPTNLVLTDVCCAGDGSVYACGREGLLLKGRDQKWEILPANGVTHDFWSLAWFAERLWLASLYGLYVLGKDGPVPVDTGERKGITSYRLTVADGVLWSVGAKDVLSFDGRTWTRID